MKDFEGTSELIVLLKKENSELQEAIAKLQDKCAQLEEENRFYAETFRTLNKYQYSENANQYIENRRKVLALSQLLNTAAESKAIDISAKEGHSEGKIQTIEEIRKQLKLSECETLGALDAAKSNFSTIKVGFGLEITGYKLERVKGCLVIPSVIGGLQVEGIGESAFQNDDFKSVILPNTVKYIKEKAFNNCRNLESVILPSGLSKLGQYCFAKTNLKALEIPRNITAIPKGCFSECRNLRTVKLNSELQSIESDAFESTAIEKIRIPEKVKSIETNAFGRHKYDYYGKRSLEIAFVGNNYIYVAQGSLSDIPTIYCLKGGAIYQELCKKNYKLKTLSEYTDS